MTSDNEMLLRKVLHVLVKSLTEDELVAFSDIVDRDVNCLVSLIDIHLIESRGEGVDQSDTNADLVLLRLAVGSRLMRHPLESDKQFTVVNSRGEILQVIGLGERRLLPEPEMSPEIADVIRKP